MKRQPSSVMGIFGGLALFGIVAFWCVHFSFKQSKSITKFNFDDKGDGHISSASNSNASPLSASISHPSHAQLVDDLDGNVTLPHDDDDEEKVAPLFTGMDLEISAPFPDFPALSKVVIKYSSRHSKRDAFKPSIKNIIPENRCFVLEHPTGSLTFTLDSDSRIISLSKNEVAKDAKAVQVFSSDGIKVDGPLAIPEKDIQLFITNMQPHAESFAKIPEWLSTQENISLADKDDFFILFRLTVDIKAPFKEPKKFSEPNQNTKPASISSSVSSSLKIVQSASIIITDFQTGLSVKEKSGPSFIVSTFLFCAVKADEKSPDSKIAQIKAKIDKASSKLHVFITAFSKPLKFKLDFEKKKLSIDPETMTSYANKVKILRVDEKQSDSILCDGNSVILVSNLDISENFEESVYENFESWFRRQSSLKENDFIAILYPDFVKDQVKSTTDLTQAAPANSESTSSIIPSEPNAIQSGSQKLQIKFGNDIKKIGDKNALPLSATCSYHLYGIKQSLDKLAEAKLTFDAKESQLALDAFGREQILLNVDPKTLELKLTDEKLKNRVHIFNSKDLSSQISTLSTDPVILVSSHDDLPSDPTGLVDLKDPSAGEWLKHQLLIKDIESRYLIQIKLSIDENDKAEQFKAIFNHPQKDEPEPMKEESLPLMTLLDLSSVVIISGSNGATLSLPLSISYYACGDDSKTKNVVVSYSENRLKIQIDALCEHSFPLDSKSLVLRNVSNQALLFSEDMNDVETVTVA